MSDALLQLNQIKQSYGQQIVLNNLSFELKKGEIGCLLGSSGCGKTTALRCIAGFETIADGEIWLDAVCISSSLIFMPPEQRRIGMVFQDYALFPHLNVMENIGFGLHSLSQSERKRRVEELLYVVQLIGIANRYPHELSGGQQQRVALARALAPKPSLLLLDEPFSNLDVTLREQLSVEIRDIIKELGATAILVTHDQTEALAIADKIGVMNHGEILQWDTAFNIYHRPINRFVANFIGQGAFVTGSVIDNRHVAIELGILMSEVPQQSENGSLVDVFLRPNDIIHDDTSPILATVTQKTFRGADILYSLRLESGSVVLAIVSSHHDHQIGEKIGIKLEVDHVVTFKR